MAHDGAERFLNTLIFGGARGERRSKEQERLELQQLFDEIDTDQSGVLSNEELRLFLTSAGLAPEETEEFFRLGLPPSPRLFEALCLALLFTVYVRSCRQDSGRGCRRLH